MILSLCNLANLPLCKEGEGGGGGGGRGREEERKEGRRTLVGVFDEFSDAIAVF